MRDFIASQIQGEKVISNFFETHRDVLKMNDIEIYNEAVQAYGYEPLNADVAMSLLHYIDTLRYIYSRPALLQSIKSFNKSEETNKPYVFTVRRV